MLSAALVRPPVSLDTAGLSQSGLSPGEAERLTGWLLVRLLEEGYTVVPEPDQAGIAISIAADAEGYVVVADGAEHRSYAVSAGPASVVSMEILHRAILALDQSGKPEPVRADAGAAAAAVEVLGQPDQALERQLREKAALALSKAGLTLVHPSQPHDRVLCIDADGERILLGNGPTRAACSDAVEVARLGDPNAEIASAVRAGFVAKSGPSPAEHDRGPSKPPPAAKPQRREGSARPIPIEVGAAGGVLLRGGGSDPLLQVRADAGEGLCLRGQAELSFSSVPEGLDVLEPSLQGGVAWCERGDHRAQVSIGLVGGVRLHHYEFDDEAGNRVGWQAAVPVDVSFVVAPAIVRFGAEVGVAGPTIEHEVLGVPVWRRSGTFVALVLGVGARP